MAVFRVERNKGYTVMSNHHLRNKDLTLKAKGLLSQMLSLPEDWDYTLAGLSHINRESIDAIRTAVWELEKAGYTLQSAKITTLPKIHIQFCRTLSFVLFFDFRYLFCGGCYNPKPRIAYAVEQRVKLPPLRVLFGGLI